MIYGILSDIHSNLEALSVVVEFLKRKKATHFLCAGDIVGYGPNPNECVNLISKLSPLTICSGNHDRAACGLKGLTWFNEYAQKALVWTTRTLTQNNQIYLSELPKTASEGEFTLVHGSPRDPDEYLLTRSQYEENIPNLVTDITLVGHTHVPFVFGPGITNLLKDSSGIILPGGTKYVINAGSVGQPRDGDSRAACGLFDSRKRTFELHRLEYDVSETQRKMRGLRLPGYLIERLSWGS